VWLSTLSIIIHSEHLFDTVTLEQIAKQAQARREQATGGVPQGVGKIYVIAPTRDSVLPCCSSELSSSSTRAKSRAIRKPRIPR
jgi:hypothetical protein